MKHGHTWMFRVLVGGLLVGLTIVASPIIFVLLVLIGPPILLLILSARAVFGGRSARIAPHR